MLKKIGNLLTLITFAAFANAEDYKTLTANFVKGDAGIQSLSVMTFGPEGILFVGDAIGGQVLAIDIDDRKETSINLESPSELADIEGKLAAMLGTDSKGVVIHDMAVNPISKNTYLTVSKADANQLGFWALPNDIANANILIKITPAGDISEVNLDNIKHSKTSLNNLIESGKHRWKKVDKKSDAIMDLAYHEGQLYIASLSNQEFASALKVVDFPFNEEAEMHASVEVWHIAHNKSETQSPIRTLMPYVIDGESQLLAAYTCTPFVSIPLSDIKNGKHIKSSTLAEFGAGNIPIDIISYNKNGKDYILMSNASKALIRINPDDIANQKAITDPLSEGEYTKGLPHDVLSRVGISQIDNYANGVKALQRMPNGQLNLVSYPVRWL